MLMSIIMNKLRVWLAYRETVFQLEALAERDLSDLGIGRRDIKRLAREAAKATQIRSGSHAGTMPMQVVESSAAR